MTQYFGGFERWLDSVDQHLFQIAGVGIDDLADFAYRDAYDDEVPPGDVADDVLAENGWRTS